MKHHPELKKEAVSDGKKEGSPLAAAKQPALMQDRSEPGWARALSLVFTVGSTICLLAICITTVFIYNLVYDQRQLVLAPILVGLALAPILGLIIFEVAHVKALLGHRWLRSRNQIKMRALVSVVIAGSLGLVHPQLMLPVLSGAAFALLLSKWGTVAFHNEPMWDFLPSEAVSVLAGRDSLGLSWAAQPNKVSSMMDTCLQAISWMALLAAFAISVRLAAQGFLNVAAAPASALISFLCVNWIGRYFLTRSTRSSRLPLEAASVNNLASKLAIDQVGNEVGGLQVAGMTVFSSEGRSLLSDINFNVEIGQMVGLTGDSYAGKSLLMKCIIDPHHQEGLEIRGATLLNGDDLWSRGAQLQTVPAVLVPADPPMLPANGARNTTCFNEKTEAARAQKIMRQLSLSNDAAEHIWEMKNAQNLSKSERKLLGFTRAFTLRPRLLLLDCPEDGANDALIGALLHRIKQESRLGLSTVIATNNRKILEACDRLLVLQGGRIVDSGPASEVRARTLAGWNRFVTERDSSSEPALNSWIDAQFRRDGDSENRRNVCTVANELLAFSCRSILGMELDQNLIFEFKHFEGHCELRMLDQAAPMSSAVLDAAQAEALSLSDEKRLSPLAAAIHDSLELDASTENGKRVLSVKIKTYNPRHDVPKKETFDAS